MGYLSWQGSLPTFSAVIVSWLTEVLMNSLVTKQLDSLSASMLTISEAASTATSSHLFFSVVLPRFVQEVGATDVYVLTQGVLPERSHSHCLFCYTAEQKPDEAGKEWPVLPAELSKQLFAEPGPTVLTGEQVLDWRGDVTGHTVDSATRLWIGVTATSGIHAEQICLLLSFDMPEVTPDWLTKVSSLGRYVAMQAGLLLAAEGGQQRAVQAELQLEGLNTRLLSEVQDKKRIQTFQRALFSITELANSSLSLQAFLLGLYQLLNELIEARNFQVALYNSDTDMIRFPYYVDEHQAVLPDRKPGVGLIEQVLHGGRSLLVNDKPGPVPDTSAEQHPVHSWLGVPLYSGHELLGVLVVLSYDRQRYYGYREQEFLEFLANTIGTALSRIRMIDELQLAYGELEQRVKERTRKLDEVNAQLEFDSLHDPLTKLPNRMFFSRALKQAWEAYQQVQKPRFALVFIDLDRFKLVNDTLGHLAGDHLLFEAGARLRGCLSDMDFLARLGGDEFAVLLQNISSLEQAEQTVKRMIKAFEQPIILAGREVFSSVSMGVVLADNDYYFKADDLLRDADHAMYWTKQQGRQGYTLFNQQLRIDQADQLALETELRKALDEQGQLVPYYQPLIDATSGQLAGFEALVRWHHPVRGILLPGAFLTIAQESGLITRLDRHIIEAACQQLSIWYQQGHIDDESVLHINLSSAHFHDADFLDWLQQLLNEWEFPPSMLHLEITESALIDVPVRAEIMMAALQKMGVRLALDDFGTGYSALSYLHRYPFDVLKIDRSFVCDLDYKDQSVAIVRAILAMASALGLSVVAEGVETLSQVIRLQKMGCAKVQGFYFARPLPAADIDWDSAKRYAIT